MKTFEAIDRFKRMNELDLLDLQNKAISGVIQQMHSKGVYLPLSFDTTISDTSVTSIARSYYYPYTDDEFLYDKLIQLEETSPYYSKNFITLFENVVVIENVTFTATINIIFELIEEDVDLLKDLGIMREKYNSGYSSTVVACNL